MVVAWSPYGHLMVSQRYLILLVFPSLLMLWAVPESPTGSDDVPGEDGGHAAS